MNEFIYLTVPIKYKCVYEKLLIKISELGIDLIKDCNIICDCLNKSIITCWNLFQSACASYALGEIKLADFMIDYISKQLNFNCPDLSRFIFIGHSDIKPNEFKNISIDSLLNLENIKTYNINDINDIQFNQENIIHFVCIPNKTVILNNAYFGTTLQTTLWNGVENESAYHLIKNQIYNGIEYTIYFYYSPVGKFDEVIHLNCTTIN